MSGYLSTGMHVHGKPVKLISWPANAGSVRFEFVTPQQCGGTEVTMFVGYELARDIHEALAPVFERHGIACEISMRETG